MYHEDMLRYLSTLLTILAFSFGQAAFAMTTLAPPTTPSGQSAYSFVRVVLGIVIKIAIPALVVLLVFFAFRIVIAQGDERALAEAKHHLIIAIVVTAVFLGLGLAATIIYNTGSSIGYVKLF